MKRIQFLSSQNSLTGKQTVFWHMNSKEREESRPLFREAFLEKGTPELGFEDRMEVFQVEEGSSTDTASRPVSGSIIP